MSAPMSERIRFYSAESPATGPAGVPGSGGTGAAGSFGSKARRWLPGTSLNLRSVRQNLPSDRCASAERPIPEDHLRVQQRDDEEGTKGREDRVGVGVRLRVKLGRYASPRGASRLQ